MFLLKVILRLTFSLHSVHRCPFQKVSFIALPCFKVGTVLAGLEYKGCLSLWLRAWVQILDLLLPGWVTSSKLFTLLLLHFSHLVLTVANFIGDPLPWHSLHLCPQMASHWVTCSLQPENIRWPSEHPQPMCGAGKKYQELKLQGMGSTLWWKKVWRTIP